MSTTTDALRWDFFIAHAGADKAAAEQVYEFLKPSAHVFLDSRCLELGDDWDQKLADAQRSALVTIVLISSHTEEAYYQREEIAAAIALARGNEQAHRVVPVYLDQSVTASNAVPYGLRLKHGLTVSNELGLDGVASRLLELLARMRDTTSSGASGLTNMTVVLDDSYGKWIRTPPDARKAAKELFSADAVVAEVALNDLVVIGPYCLDHVFSRDLCRGVTPYQRRRVARLIGTLGEPASTRLADMIVDGTGSWFAMDLAARCFPEAVTTAAYNRLERMLPFSGDLRQDPLLVSVHNVPIDRIRLALLALARTRVEGAAWRLQQMAKSLLLSDPSENSHVYFREKFGPYAVQALILLGDRAVMHSDREAALWTLGRIIETDWEPQGWGSYDYEAALTEHSDSLGPRAIDAFIRLANWRGASRVRNLAINALGAIRSERSRPTLEALALSGTEDLETRARACSALADLGGEQSFRSVHQVLADVSADWDRGKWDARPDDSEAQEHRLNQLKRVLAVAAALARLLPWGGDDALALVNVNEDKVYFGTKHLLVSARAYLGDLEALRQASRDSDPLVRAMSALALGRQKPRAECISLLKRMSAEASTELEKIATEAGLGLHAASDGKELHSALVQATRMDAKLLDDLTREVKREIVDSLISACGLDDPCTVAWSVHLGLNPASARDEVALLRALNGSYETDA
jgi:hypothetical protein